jgi:proline dehydrogenase
MSSMSFINRAVASLLPLVPKAVVGRVARPYIAGESLDQAVTKVRALMEEGCCATMDVLGEEVLHQAESEAFTDQYLDVLRCIASEGIDSNISVKPTALGLNLDLALCESNLRRIVGLAAELDNFVRIDMEDSSTTTATLDIYRRLRDDHDNVGVVLQSYLHRSMDDIETLIPYGVSVRVCKGIYVEPAPIAFKARQEIRDNFMKMVEALLVAGCYVGIATHDRQLVKRSMETVERMGMDKSDYEFQVLLGVLPGLRREIIAAGHRMRVYVPFGEAWYAYSTRRLKENPAVAGHVLRGIFTSK